MSPTELKMQPTIHLEPKAGYGRGEHPAVPSRCIVGCIVNCAGLIITREIPCIEVNRLQYQRSDMQNRNKIALRKKKQEKKSSKAENVKNLLIYIDQLKKLFLRSKE
jgi:hypothetical protein